MTSGTHPGAESTHTMSEHHGHPTGAIERIPVRVFEQAADANRAVAKQVADLIRERAAQGRNCVLGLATGSTPVGVYDELVRMHREEGLSLANVITFNLDEYFPMQPHELQSYVRFMREHLFDLVDIQPGNWHVPDGTIAIEQVADHCRWYEEQIAQAGGVDIQILGIGRTGHIGFNEPGSGLESRTRLITLDRVTRIDAASDFFGQENVPRRAITMGVGTILEARQIVMLAFGEHKAGILCEAVEKPSNPSIAASFLQQHPNAVVVADEAAADKLTRSRAPWLVGHVEWDETLIRKAVIWLARTLDKPVLKLTDLDYNENGLQDLLAEHGPAYNIKRQGFPPSAVDDHRLARRQTRPRQATRRPLDAHDHIFPKRVLVFSPHPDDDVISMGGTLIRLVDQGHEVHVAYQTSGNIAVFDEDAIRFADFVSEFNRHFDVSPERTGQLEAHVEEFLRNKQPGQVDSPEVQMIKTLIRRSETRAAGRCCNIPVERLHFMDLPFYETGRVKKKPLSGDDIRMTVDLLRRIKPHQIYAAGDLSDPHGTHRTCLAAVLRSCRECANDDWYRDCEIWLYRGAWQEWAPNQIEMAVPLSPSELDRKRAAIFKHESQKDRALFPAPTCANSGNAPNSATAKPPASTTASASPNTKPSKALSSGTPRPCNWIKAGAAAKNI